MTAIPAQYTGQAAMEKQDPKKYELHEHAYTPRAFTEDDVIIKIECCGICGSDLHTINCGWATHSKFPSIVGHEIIGHVVRAGSKTTHKVGDRVGFGAQTGSCLRDDCSACSSGAENYCARMVGTYGGRTGDKVQPYTQGGYADYYQGAGHFAIPIPAELESAVAAPMLCAGVTVYAPLKRHGAGPGTKVGIVGIGGLGHLGVQFAAALGAEVYALSHSDRKRGDATALGAKGFIVANRDTRSQVLKEHGASFDLLLSTSNEDNMPLNELYLPLLKSHGTFAVVGLPNSGFPGLGMGILGKRVAGSLIGSTAELAEMFQLAVDKGVRTWVETRPMSQATQAVQDMEDGKAKYRFVLVNDNVPAAAL